ncbi:unnamed protein product [Paramecium octaurelia]|uniref:Uncharacterized protein n=1 Tax=Paramecium octaurelia TaxID=43137 RepID=A0A8S1U7B1_PAROT|nr:unnamed protein product [Paramecium octaurelia]
MSQLYKRKCLIFIFVFGIGGFGKAWKVEYKKQWLYICNERNVKSTLCQLIQFRFIEKIVLTQL